MLKVFLQPRKNKCIIAALPLEETVLLFRRRLLLSACCLLPHLSLRVPSMFQDPGQSQVKGTQRLRWQHLPWLTLFQTENLAQPLSAFCWYVSWSSGLPFNKFHTALWLWLNCFSNPQLKNLSPPLPRALISLTTWYFDVSCLALGPSFTNHTHELLGWASPSVYTVTHPPQFLSKRVAGHLGSFFKEIL